MKPIEKPASRQKGNEVIAYFAMLLTSLLKSKGVDEKDANVIAVDAMDVMKKEFGGQNIYFSKEVQAKASERNNELYDRWMRNETSIEDLAYEYEISIQRVYQIINEVRFKRRNERDAEREEQRSKEFDRWKREN